LPSVARYAEILPLWGLVWGLSKKSPNKRPPS
jgi:hypothetical protein